MLEADAGNPELGLKLLQEAAPELRRDPRLTLWHDAAMAPVLASLGREEETRALIASIEEHAGAYEADVATQERCWAGIGRALLTLNDPAGARSAWLRFLAGPPEPVDRPEGYYQMGECERLLANTEAAWQAYRSAGSLGIETRYARRARQRMKDEGGRMNDEGNRVIAPAELGDEGAPPAAGQESPGARETR